MSGLLQHPLWIIVFAFIKDNIQNRKALKLGLNAIKPVKAIWTTRLSIQVPVNFFYEWLEEALCKLLKVSLTKTPN